MFDNKYLINLYVLSLDKSYELFVPGNEKVGNIVKLLDKGLLNLDINLDIGAVVLLNLDTGEIYKNNDIIKKTNIKNSSRLMLL